MIKSMTGYGSASGSCEGIKISVELKSVNNRYLDCSVRLPRSVLSAEEAVKSLVQKHISRGKVDLYISLEYTDGDDAIVRVNDKLAGEYLTAVRNLAQEYSLQPDISALELSRMPDVLSLEKRDADVDAIRSVICDITEQALCEFDAMRSREGEKLRADITSRLKTVEQYLSIVEQRSPETVQEYREKLYRKMCDVLHTTTVDEQRILMEAALFADKTAVDEETVRLHSHISQMNEMLETGSPIGRKMDFLVQEFNRESNTIGSKCNDSSITKIVVELKSEIEKIREQIQNIE